MRGSVKRSGPGWMYRFDAPTVTGERRQVLKRGFRTKGEAADAMRDAMAAAKGGTLVRHSRSTVGQYLADVWLPAIAMRVRPTTLDAYRRAVATHITPGLGAVELQALDEVTVARWVMSLESAGRLSAKSIKNVHGALSKAMSDAVRLRLVSRNVAHGADLPRVQPRPPRAWTAAQLALFLGHVESDRWAPLWRLLATTGMRRGEALGLRWCDVDLTARTVTITNQRAIAGGKVVEGAPKTASGHRTVKLDVTTAAMLRSWRSIRAEERLMLAGSAPGDYVFTWPTGEPLWPQRVTAWFKDHAEALGLPNVGLHGLRHSAATWMIGTGVSPKLVAQRLGHAHVSVTLQLYSHVLPAHDEEAADAFAQALDRPRSARE